MNLQVNPETKKQTVDWLTAAALAGLVVSLTIWLHESTHALVCLATKTPVTEYSALYISCDGAPWLAGKVIAGSASLINLLLGTLAWFWLRRINDQHSTQTWFVWLFMLVNWLQGAGYWMFSGFSGIGDWADVIAGVPNQTLWQIGMAVGGSIVYMALVWLSLMELGRIIGGSEPELYGRAVRLGMISYLTAIVTIVLVGLFNPYGFTSLPVTAALAAALGGLSPLIWMMFWFRAAMFRKMGGAPLLIPRSWPLVVTSFVVVLVYAAVLGRTLYF